MSTLIKNMFFFFFLQQVILANPIGWGKKKYHTSKVHTASFFQDTTNQVGFVYFVTLHLKKKFNKNTKTEILLKIHQYNGNKTYSKDLIKIHLDKANLLFPLHPSIAVYRKKIYVFWQETSSANESTLIKYMYSSNGIDNFNQPKIVNTNSNIAVLPQIKIDSLGSFHLFYQIEQQNGKFNLIHSIVKENNFLNKNRVIKDINLIGQGVFSPSIIFHQNKIYIFYQNRFKNNYRDEIYYIVSNNKGSSFSEAKRLTDNKTNDFSPFATIVNNKIEWVWQGRQEKTWSIFHSGFSLDSKVINDSSAHSYMPQFQYNKKIGRVVVWFDFRKHPAQIFSKFLDQVHNHYTGKDHNVSLERAQARNPVLIKQKNNLYLFYISRGILYSKKVDTQTEKILIKSSHPFKKAIKKNKVSFYWKKPKDVSGVLDYAYLINKNPNSILEIFNVNRSVSTITTNLAGGNYFFHLKYRDKAGNESQISRYNFIIDNSPPTAPIITSNTHQEGLSSDKSDINFQFISNDDSGIKQYIYSFSRNRVQKLNKTTAKQSLKFKSKHAGIYYLKIQAEDLAGNKSDISIFKIQIEPKDSEDLKVFCNITDGKLTKENLLCDIFIRENQSIQKIMAFVDHKEVNPFLTEKEIKFSKKNSHYKINIPVSKLSRGIYILSIGVIFSNNKKSQVRTRNFEKGQSLDIFSKTKISKRNRKVRTSINNTSYKNKNNKKIDYTLFIPKIISINTGSLYKISFKISKKYKSYIKGFSWHLTDKPEMPDISIDSHGGPEYIYNLEKGTYHLTVKPILKDLIKRKYNKSILNKIYSNKIIKIDNTDVFNYYLLFLTLPFLLVFYIIITKKQKLKFYLSKYRNTIS